MKINGYEIKPGANLVGADLRGADLRYANLDGANLEGADLRNADLRGADLRYANLRGANLVNANLRYANLRGANLEGADLEGADLRNADLRNADLVNAKLEGAKLEGANITGTILEKKEDDKDFDKNKLLKECRQTGRTTATTEKVLKTVFSQMTDKKTLECEIEEYALEIEQKAKEIGKLKDILDRKEQQLKQMKETDISKVLIEGDTATINGIKYKRVEEPKPKTLYEVLTNLGYYEDNCDVILDAVKECLPDEHCNITDYDLGWNDVLSKIKDGLG
jgi:uncharacterized protein YjbI with pentapeptide repeats